MVLTPLPSHKWGEEYEVQATGPEAPMHVDSSSSAAALEHGKWQLMPVRVRLLLAPPVLGGLKLFSQHGDSVAEETKGPRHPL